MAFAATYVGPSYVNGRPAEIFTFTKLAGDTTGSVTLQNLRKAAKIARPRLSVNTNVPLAAGRGTIDATNVKKLNITNLDASTTGTIVIVGRKR